VDTDHAYPDEAGLADRLASTGSAKSPGFEGVALVALLAGLALLLRRR
jgi:LPXTG-motif cell wall-anchored protein